MDARLLRIGICLAALSSLGASQRTPNFEVHAPTPQIAKQVAEAAEYYREQLSIEWLGHPMPRWFKPCPIFVKVGQLGAGGATSFSFDKGEVFGWRMNVQGSLERILDSVLPHEVSHTIFACHFRSPLPRWADEGAATLVEHESERMRQRRLMSQVLNTSRKIPLRKLFSIREYPSDMQSVLTLYAEGYSLADFLVQQGGKAKYLAFLGDALKEGWDKSLDQHYGHRSVEAFEKRWNAWVLAGSPNLVIPKNQMIAENEPAEQEEPIVRGQSPEPKQTLPASGHSRQLASTGETRILRGTELSAPNPGPETKMVANTSTPEDHFLSNPSRMQQAVENAGNAGWMPIEQQSRVRPVGRPLRLPITQRDNNSLESTKAGRPTWSVYPQSKQYR